MRKRIALLLALPLLLAANYPDQNGWVNDHANVFSTEARAALEKELEAYATTSNNKNEIAVAIFPSLNGESLEDYSMHIAEKWKIGKKGKDNGVLLTLFLQDHKDRIDVGYGLEGILPDAKCHRILDEVMAPLLKAGKTSEAVVAGIHAIRGQIDSGGKDEIVASTPQQGIPWGLIMIIVAVVIVLIFLDFIFFDGSITGVILGCLLSGDSGGGGGGGGGSFGGGGAGGSW